MPLTIAALLAFVLGEPLCGQETELEVLQDIRTAIADLEQTVFDESAAISAELQAHSDVNTVNAQRFYNAAFWIISAILLLMLLRDAIFDRGG